MAVWDTRLFLGVMLLLAGASAYGVHYVRPVCAVKGSTVTFLCTFTPPQCISQDGKEVPVKVVRVRWCQNHLICQGSTPTVYSSESRNNDPRYRYLGDREGDCTLQVTGVQKEDEATLRFRMEFNNSRANYVGKSGVNVTVTDAVRMRINGSRVDGDMRGGENVTLLCTARCTFHHLEVTWFKDGRALSVCGPALQLTALAAKDSGSYSCGLKTDAASVSLPYRVKVEAQQEQTGTNGDGLLVVRLVLFALHTLLVVIVASVVIRRMCFRESSRKQKEVMVQSSDLIQEL